MFTTITGELNGVPDYFFTDILNINDDTIITKKIFGGVNVKVIFENKQKCSVKLLKNSAFILTGNKSRDEILRSTIKICNLTGGAIIDLKFAMINTTFKNCEELHLLTTFAKLEKKGVLCLYDPQCYAGIAVKHNKLRCLIFKRATIITGNKTIQECNDAFNYMQNLLFNHENFDAMANDTVELKI